MLEKMCIVYLSIHARRFCFTSAFLSNGCADNMQFHVIKDNFVCFVFYHVIRNINCLNLASVAIRG